MSFNLLFQIEKLNFFCVKSTLSMAGNIKQGKNTSHKYGVHCVELHAGCFVKLLIVCKITLCVKLHTKHDIQYTQCVKLDTVC